LECEDAKLKTIFTLLHESFNRRCAFYLYVACIPCIFLFHSLGAFFARE